MSTAGQGSTVLVTGGTGTLGREVVRQLGAAGHAVRVLSRRPQERAAAGVEWAVGDLTTGAGVAEAVSGVDVIVHCASDGRAPAGDLAGARTLLDAARAAGSPHLVYISIVGVDRVPFRYYRVKLEVERLIEDSGLPWTVLRATQFHDLVLMLTRLLAKSPVVPVPARTRIQPVDVRDVAARLVQLASGPPAGRVPDLGGPEVRSVADLVRATIRALGLRRFVVPVPVPLPGKAAAGYRRGGHLAPEHADGRGTYAEFLRHALVREAPDR